MKSKLTPCTIAMLAGVIFTLGFSPATTFAQGTEFTYQGRLNDGASSANGIYDLRFAIYDALTFGTQHGPILTNSATVVSNGLFTVKLDFGNQFPGANRWLEIGVRTNGSGVFTTLNPRQKLMPAPYAVFAGNAATITGTISAGQITGTLPQSVLPAGVVTNGATGVSVSGTFVGNGAGLINVPGAIPSQTVTGTNISAQPNVAYVSTNVAAVTFTLPTNASVGDVVRVDGVGAGGWQVQPGPGQFINQYSAGAVWIARETSRGWASVASSADGNKLVAVDLGLRIYTSTDAGTNWIARESNRYWRSVASSADGNKLVAVIGADIVLGQIYTSTDSGTNWVARGSTNNWWSVASSADGSKLVAVDKGGQIYTSADGGTNWMARESNRYWVSVASSADGSKLAAVVGNGQIYNSTDSGTNWTAREGNRSWSSVASSADGNKLVAVAGGGGPIYTSTDNGTNWTSRDSSRNWMSVASSADGTNLAAVESGGQIYTSTDSGISWSARESNRSWQAVASSADGSKLVAVVYVGQIYTSSAIPLVGAQGSTVELQNSGNGVWQQLNRLDAGNISSGTLADTRLSSNVALLSANQTFTGQNILNNAANIFAGNGSGLTGLSAASVTSGTFADTRLSANVALLNAGQTFFGQNVFNNAANSFAGSGAGLTSLNASQLASGTILDARLSSNVALRSGGNAFTGNQTITGGSVGIGITPQSTLDVNGTARIDGANNWNVTGSEGDFRVGNDSFRFKIGVANGGGGAGDVWMRAQGGTARVFIKTPGGTTFFSNEGETAGVSLAANGTAWAVVSDRNVKKDFASVNSVQILEKLAAMPITQWHYKWENSDVTPHIGPMAQDFKAAFYPGTDDKSITTQEADGVALAAIQGLNQKLEETRAENAELKQQLTELKQLVQTLATKH